MLEGGEDVTLPETNIAPENGWLEGQISFWEGRFSAAKLVSGSVIKKSLLVAASALDHELPFC